MKLEDVFSQNKFIVKIRKNITLKLFVITTLVFTIFITSTLVFESLFFGKFYISQKKRNLQNRLEKFEDSYNKTKDKEAAVNLIRSFEEDNNSKIVIVDKNGKIKFLTSPDTRGYDEIRVKIINDIIVEWNMNSNLLDEMKSKDKPITVVTEMRINGVKNILSAVPDNKKGEIIFAIISLQPVNEASLVIKQFYVYFYIGAIVLIVILSLIYTNMVSNPLVKMNNVAKKMALMNFSEKCNIESEDEIGNLASTLNFLSNNLDNALTSLKEANKKLEDDIEKERKLEKTRKNFIDSVSHELKTPINLIGGYAEGLKDRVFESEKRDYYIDIIIDESRKMAGLVNDMLNLSHMESGTFKLTKEKFFIDKLVNSVIHRFSVIIESKGIHLENRMLKNIEIYADWDAIEQVTTNFLTNAIRYTDEGGKIVFSTKKTNGDVIVSVENSGRHIPEPQIDKVWDNFYRIDKSRNRKLGGTGLGLSIVKNILTLHRYKYGVKNTDMGVKFYFICNTIEK
ncbi:MAG: cell wall metabolism sensor histidine kinase WalK [Clostridium sp.]|jgi:signal transduction histidine kinase|uniref:ATP-binding protein n=1 Tax=Clostridium sp. TaxID=1506 RepID=UPI0025C69EE2|nr:ATP-binding protein [Clostridium sp.]MCH3963237.1 cell wall metabolism sensor histidine kinase WalK [Clostridium sp.]MCI1717209.1 cell wall metabolism sensor histidine kinase WalK [Clostridium sp.]MCI1801549.1 cell wall metabolism sensor histidine kinase WalK [Clostridium sp.]MCI1815395.1 cell wall metabolism sensor histidine kinase WalK [Clostridium sp.]MCI1872298.1 cell wall metabolism sensor histidine kinase WalK [Clostridium sp.]